MLSMGEGLASLALITSLFPFLMLNLGLLSHHVSHQKCLTARRRNNHAVKQFDYTLNPYEFEANRSLIECQSVL